VSAVAFDTLEERAAGLAREKQRGRRLRFTLYAAVLFMVAWSVKVIAVDDTDWSRILGASLLSTAKGFVDVDLSIVGDLWEPALDTLLMATVATLAGLVFSIPVAWLGAANITPLGRFSYVIGRFLMTMSRSVHEIVWGLIFVSAVGLGANRTRITPLSCTSQVCTALLW